MWEAVVNKGDGDRRSDWKPGFAWHRWNFCDHQYDQWSSSNCLWSQRWSTRRLFTSSVMIIKRDHIIGEAKCHGAVFTNILSILFFLHLSTQQTKKGIWQKWFRKYRKPEYNPPPGHPLKKWRHLWTAPNDDDVYLTNATRNTFLFSNSCRDENCRFGTDDQNWGDFGGLHTNEITAILV